MKRLVYAVLVLGWSGMVASSLELAAQTPTTEAPKAVEAPRAVETPAPAPQISPAMAELLSHTTFSGYLSTSYFFNFNNPSNDINTGRSFDNKSDEFSLNKLHLTLDNPVEYSSENWDAGFHTDVIFGEDAPLLQSAGLSLGNQGDLEEANFTVNVPIGNGLKVSAGKWATYMGVEVIEETLNPNWSEGNQFLFVENFTHLGVGLEYKWCDWLETKARITNGWDVVKDNNNAKSFMGAIVVTPDEDTLLALVPYGGPEQSQAATTGSASAWRSGLNFVGSRAITSELKAYLQLDYGHENENTALADPTNDADWYAAGIWLTYQCCEKVGVAFRADYFNDPDGARTSGAPFTAPFPANTGQELTSFTFTVNYLPLKNVQVRPEIRWDHSTLDDAFANDRDQVTVGCGAAFLF